MTDLDLSRLYDETLPEDALVVPSGWVLIEFIGGSHGGTKCWADRPREIVQVTADGTTYTRQAGVPNVYLAPGAAPVEPLDDPDQLSLS